MDNVTLQKKSVIKKGKKYMADQDTEGLLSPFLRNQRLKAIKPYLQGKVLDVGCGTGSLAGEVSPDHYLEVEIDQFSLESAISKFPKHRFQKALPNETEKFDTVIALAVIEHVKRPEQFLAELSKRLKPTESARVVITTPHPSMDWIHDFGASIGLFSKHANEEHEELLDCAKLESISNKVELRLVYKRFLFGANQLAVFEHKFI